MVSAATSAFSGLNGSPAIAAAQQASQYCESRGKHVITRRMDTSGRVGFGNVSVTYVFSCIAEDDPEYKRPDLRQDPSVVIEDRRQ